MNDSQIDNNNTLCQSNLNNMTVMNSFNSKNFILIACESEYLCNKWVCLINFLMKHTQNIIKEENKDNNYTENEDNVDNEDIYKNEENNDINDIEG